MRIWARLIKDNRICRDMVVENYDDDTRTHKVFDALDRVTHDFDLSRPIWLDATVSEFKRHGRCRFYQDSFIDSLEYDYLEFQILEED